jgi:hypothetical protein
VGEERERGDGVKREGSEEGEGREERREKIEKRRFE